MPKKHKKSEKEVSADSQEYKGPIILKAMKQEEELYTVPLIFTGLLTSSAGGVLDAYYSSDPTSYALTEWTALAGLYGEYRTLGLEVRFYPHNRYSKTTTTCTPLVVLVDRESPSALSGSYQTAAAHESSEIKSLEDPWKRSAKMQNTEESAFKSTASASVLFSVKFYADGLTVSTVYGRVFVNLLLQFRARR